MIPTALKELSLRVSQYFLDFLESDFKRQQAPRRRIILHTESGFKAGMSLAPYASLQKTLWEELGKAWDEAQVKIAPHVYTRTLSQPLRLILREQVAALKIDAVQTVVLAVANKARKTLAQSVAAPEEWVSTVRQELVESLSGNIVRPMLAFLETALHDQAYSSVDAAFNAEGDLVAALAEPLDTALPEILARLSVSNDKVELLQAGVNLLSLEFVKSTITGFFEAFAAADAFLEIRDLETYASTAEGIQLYLYIGTIKYGSVTYPLFYLPLEIEREANSSNYILRFKNQLYANKRATDFILQELGERQQRQWLSPIAERITYLGGDESITAALQPLVNKISRAFGFSEAIRLSAGPISQQTDSNVSISNGLYVCAFEMADEALLNDYEEMIAQIRTNQQGVVELFHSIVSDVITANPISIAATVEQEWDSTDIGVRCVPDSPIPLNEEQQKVLRAIRNKEGRFIVVEGPPGTGKSHTIVAIAADCAFRQKSCLVLSDKPEALEVVYSKLSAAMDEVRGSEDFPNPLLRLGADQANFKRLTSPHTMTQVTAHVKAAGANRKNIEADRDHKRESLRGQISLAVATCGAIKTSEIAACQRCAEEIDAHGGVGTADVLDELYDRTRLNPFESTTADYGRLEKFISEQFAVGASESLSAIALRLATYRFAAGLAPNIDLKAIRNCIGLTLPQLHKLSEILNELDALKRPLIGWALRKKRLRILASKCQSGSSFSRQIEFPLDRGMLKAVLDAGRALATALAAHGDENITFENAHIVLTRECPQIDGLEDFARFINVMRKAADVNVLRRLQGNALPETKAHLWALSMRYMSSLRHLHEAFAKVPEVDYVARKTGIERLNTALMNAEVDSRLVAFMENSRADAKVLAKLIKARQKFPEEKFELVRNAFPVMIASIRDFGEYMPLKHDLLDVLVIDEASQVSVAQAFPALLRAKKIVVMGDTNQFSNTKSSNASMALNQKHRGELDAFFKREVSTQADKLERLSYFDVKRSVLEFCQLCANFSIMLRKHFRSYKELISYSSVTFYGGQLQAIKLRPVPIRECIEFSILDGSADKPPRNTNPVEGEFILARCVELLDEEPPPTVGVITPFREQQSYLSRVISSHPRASDFRGKLKIKVMTFDSCQGEERKIIFYSMVATRELDLLNYIFPLHLHGAAELVGEKLKLQRLNVGFSRAQEMVWFVLSKPVAEFKGAIGDALRHFERTREKRTADPSETDPMSPMEQKVLEWIYATPFYQKRADSIEVIPQFPVGEYLKQLDLHYRHPEWRVDFLLLIEVGPDVLRVVIEYDGFEYHFKKGVEIDLGNHELYMNENDIERQLTLESYGYRFLRLNRFNLGRDPVDQLSGRLERLVNAGRNKANPSGDAVQTLAAQAEALTEKSAKVCTKCGNIKPLQEFFDRALAKGDGGHGRVCMQCKRIERQTASGQSGARRRRRRRW